MSEGRESDFPRRESPTDNTDYEAMIDADLESNFEKQQRELERALKMFSDTFSESIKEMEHLGSAAGLQELQDDIRKSSKNAALTKFLQRYQSLQSMAESSASDATLASFKDFQRPDLLEEYKARVRNTYFTGLRQSVSANAKKAASAK